MANAPARTTTKLDPSTRLDGGDRRPAQRAGPRPGGGVGLRLGRGRPALSESTPRGNSSRSQGPPVGSSRRAVSDDGTMVAMIGEGSKLWLLDGDFDLVSRATDDRRPAGDRGRPAWEVRRGLVEDKHGPVLHQARSARRSSSRRNSRLASIDLRPRQTVHGWHWCLWVDRRHRRLGQRGSNGALLTARSSGTRP